MVGFYRRLSDGAARCAALPELFLCLIGDKMEQVASLYRAVARRYRGIINFSALPGSNNKTAPFDI